MSNKLKGWFNKKDNEKLGKRNLKKILNGGKRAHSSGSLSTPQSNSHVPSSNASTDSVPNTTSESISVPILAPPETLPKGNGTTKIEEEPANDHDTSREMAIAFEVSIQNEDASGSMSQQTMEMNPNPALESPEKWTGAISPPLTESSADQSPKRTDGDPQESSLDNDKLTTPTRIVSRPRIPSSGSVNSNHRRGLPPNTITRTPSDFMVDDPKENAILFKDGELVSGEPQVITSQDPVNTVEHGMDKQSDLLASETQFILVGDAETIYLEQYMQDISEIPQLQNKVGRLQNQVREMRKYLRGLLEQQIEQYLPAAVRIQAWWRGFLVRRELQRQKLLSWHRNPKKKIYPKYYASLERLRADCSTIGPRSRIPLASSPDEKTSAALKLQAVIRGYLVRRKVDRYRRGNAAATKIQAIWRGYRVRYLDLRVALEMLSRRYRRDHTALVDWQDEMNELKARLEEEERLRADQDIRIDGLLEEIQVLKDDLAKEKEVNRKLETRLSTKRATQQHSDSDKEQHLGKKQTTPRKTNRAGSISSCSDNTAHNGALSDIFDDPSTPEGRILAKLGNFSPGTAKNLMAEVTVNRYVPMEEYEYLREEVNTMRLNYDKMEATLMALVRRVQSGDEPVVIES